ncbi:MAG: RAD55 family ATPase [Archaeoglobaceae archaeon]
MDRARFGIPKLDELLGGGLDRDTINLVIGRSGIGKTILAAHWAAEGARNGEKVLYLSTTMNQKSCRSYLGNFSFMKDVYDKIYWRFIRVDAKYFMPLTKEKVKSTLDMTFGMPGKNFDRIVFDSNTDLDKALADPVLYRKAIRYMAELSYENDVTSLWVEEAPMTGEWSETKNLVESIIFLDLLRSDRGYVRALRILKKYRSPTPLEWFPYRITENGIELLEGYLVRKDYDYEWRS